MDLSLPVADIEKFKALNQPASAPAAKPAQDKLVKLPGMDLPIFTEEFLDLNKGERLTLCRYLRCHS